MTTVPLGEELKVLARTSLVLLGGYVLQLGLFDDLRLFSVHPEVLLAIGVGTAVAWGAERGAIVGFAAGLLADLVLSGRFGVTGLAYGIACYAVGLVSEGLARRSRVMDALLMAVGGALGTITYAVVAALFGAGTLGEDDLLVIIAMVALWNFVLSPIVVPVCRWAGRHPEIRPAR
ncbi:MAG: rod shape-determining protein MreD [Microthrixaceae bacterium]|nr:rod shape-determining protein MreD [Microthrixaceae bacterium]MCB1011519.1 rod shape-determining protein MreD [Microthrixaceae bacterium]MCB9387432.1 rod shape-determining protein MreD [Microthrixaceae bacterium]MCO5322853.1 rod shape-determining protein MreD [Microthrixaceae bacterium]